MKTRYKMTLSYDGHLFHGFQAQPKQRTVQGTIESALEKMTKGQQVRIEGSGRTDAGVHALGQVIHFDYPGNKIPPQRMLCALNSMMPLDIVFNDCEIVNEDFHVRYSAKGKWYRYRLSLDRFVNPFKRFYTGHYPYQINVKKMQQAARDLIGTHDFTSFAASGGQIKNKVRTMYYINIRKDDIENEIIFDFICSGFLYNMVRILVATLLEIGNGKRPINDIPRVILAKDREQVRETAQANGLFLFHVFYEDIPLKYRQDENLY
ncbi:MULTISPECIES: tRNA pseudouridine(38-40) synthase TruA [unclassified Lactobacillus]|uniref:tRNA pseudouridine(38-40) synthase TruA n=1 Tax=unclassified Lactobacillus TaxID=2620435 RepID=UPI000EFA8AA1|nr:MULTISPECIES: tRNA pseudouridine(38-40) synthase TruA [unclassified Lactobacillus]RMC23809.1 tRNA pseudouridine(38-40) synthase TruA [Lactobacillus sp. ESL0247]RMC27553.1 tRNA pseudouridine(38-40) synthase TruA [Lactobacillus sp. ESL0246]RMC30833.1 tRNA pseudouridine(38-40) synthase TruA [Lactobacillus sp. ESL0245]RMC47575.1 tRNA pseudouridine(38-40) synthase TruA [Lactobacillus sp. ESL0228]